VNILDKRPTRRERLEAVTLANGYSPSEVEIARRILDAVNVSPGHRVPGSSYR
jgi:hypothetical protein